jgi:calcium-dependent protein kinase
MGCVKSQVETKTKVKLIEPPTPNDIKKSRRTRSKNIFNSINSSSITEHYEILKVIGSGNVGTLYFAKHLQSEEFRTLREINKIILKDEAAMLSQEVNILKELDHPNILKIYETIETARSLYISLEYISGPSLLERVKTTGCETMLAITMSEVFSALNYLHAKGFVHCNINPEYIVQTGVGYDTVNKLIGFTVAQKIEDKLDINLKKIKYQYASPELLKGDYDEKTDIWSCGILLYELLVGRLPFPSKTKAGIVECIINGDLDFINSMFTSLSKGSQDLIKSMLQIDPSLRPAAQEILLNPMFTASKGKINLSLDAIKKLRSFKVFYI